MYNNEPYILGILNVNRESESVNADVYERVDHFVPWIVKTLNSPQFSNLKRPKQYIQRQENTTDEQ